MNIGLLGGSFDPVHNGHLTVAREVLARFPLDRVLFIPAAQAPLKPSAVRASAEDRLALLRAAIGDTPGLEICDFELRKGGVSYTVDTLRHLRTVYPPESNRLFWIFGADQLAQLPRWREPGELVQLAEFVCVTRPGHALPPPPPVPGLRVHFVDTPPVDVSSTELRARIARGEPVEAWMPNNAIEYLRKTGLYRDACPTPAPARIPPANS
ncbi:nicotinate-nucleotide adenylyltransferase [Opitutaceae bacterium TAV5]|nr:nicotinate-nucleotide adenylyltransferase [Opitutaceae bacterium TAV5]